MCDDIFHIIHVYIIMCGVRVYFGGGGLKGEVLGWLNGWLVDSTGNRRGR